MTGSTKDPENGPAVAGSVFAAVIVYAVRPTPTCVKNAHWLSLSVYISMGIRDHADDD